MLSRKEARNLVASHYDDLVVNNPRLLKIAEEISSLIFERTSNLHTHLVIEDQ